jgi:hypothetical protein
MDSAQLVSLYVTFDSILVKNSSKEYLDEKGFISLQLGYSPKKVGKTTSWDNLQVNRNNVSSANLHIVIKFDSPRK